MKLIRRACVVGANGAFGKIFSKKLHSAGIEVTGIDIKKSKLRGAYHTFIRGDFGELLKRETFQAYDLLLFCTPEEVVVKHLATTLSLLDLRVCSDICSVKSRVQRTVRRLRTPKQKSISYISVHPMFGPVDDFAGYNLCIVPMQQQRRGPAQEFIKIVRSWSAEVTTLSAEEHDRLTAWSQAAVHVSILSYASAMASSGISLKVAMKIATPIEKVLLCLANRIASGAQDTNWQIQQQNPFAHTARKQLTRKLKDLIRKIDRHDYPDFSSALTTVSKYLSANGQDLKSLAASLVAAAKSS